MRNSEREHLRNAIRNLVDGPQSPQLHKLQERGHAITAQRRLRRATVAGIVTATVVAAGFTAAVIGVGASGRRLVVASGGATSSTSGTSAETAAPNSTTLCAPDQLRRATAELADAAWPTASPRPNLAIWPDYKSCTVIVVVDRPLSADEKRALIDSAPSVKLTVVVGSVEGRD